MDQAIHLHPTLAPFIARNGGPRDPFDILDYPRFREMLAIDFLVGNRDPDDTKSSSSSTTIESRDDSDNQSDLGSYQEPNSDKFTCFSKLPQEIQREIWILTVPKLPGCNVFVKPYHTFSGISQREIDAWELEEEFRFTLFWQPVLDAHRPYPVAAEVNRGSRAALAQYLKPFRCEIRETLRAITGQPVIALSENLQMLKTAWIYPKQDRIIIPSLEFVKTHLTKSQAEYIRNLVVSDDDFTQLMLTGLVPPFHDTNIPPRLDASIPLLSNLKHLFFAPNQRYARRVGGPKTLMELEVIRPNNTDFLSKRGEDANEQNWTTVHNKSTRQMLVVRYLVVREEARNKRKERSAKQANSGNGKGSAQQGEHGFDMLHRDEYQAGDFRCHFSVANCVFLDMGGQQI